MMRTDDMDVSALRILALPGAGILASSFLLDATGRFTATTALLALTGFFLWRHTRVQSAVIGSLQESVRIDPLTGLLNRGGYEERMEVELARAAREGSEFAFIIVDVDDFKDINDNLGHLGGDMALERVAAGIRRTTRAGDVVARIGGDEFAIILPRAGEIGGLSFAERLRALVRGSFAGTAADATLSVGIATFPAAGRTAEELLDAADRAMYRAKELGKDRVAVHRTDPLSPGLVGDPLAHVA